MPSINFQKQFAPGILAMLDKDYAKRTGITPKTTTIRARRKHPIKKNDVCHFTTTYDRKYYLNKKTKDAGYKLKLDKTEKTILVRQEDAEATKDNKFIKELQGKYNYGVQVLNPLFQ
jgi:hypothetical protein